MQLNPNFNTILNLYKRILHLQVGESFLVFLHFDPSSPSTWRTSFFTPRLYILLHAIPKVCSLEASSSGFCTKSFLLALHQEIRLHYLTRAFFLLQCEPSTCNISTATRRQRQLRAQRRGEQILRKREALKNWNRSRSSYLWSRYWFAELRRSRRGLIQEAITICINRQTWNQGSLLLSGMYR